MRRGGSLATRLDRIERTRQRTRRVPIQPLMTVYDRDDEIIAIAGFTGAICHREAGEPIQAFKTRSRAALGTSAGWLHAIYANDKALEPTPVATVPLPEPEPTPKPELAGIGVVGPGWRTVPADERLAP